MHLFLELQAANKFSEKKKTQWLIKNDLFLGVTRDIGMRIALNCRAFGQDNSLPFTQNLSQFKQVVRTCFCDRFHLIDKMDRACNVGQS